MKFKFNPLDWAMVAIAGLVIGSIIFQSCRPEWDKRKPGTVTVSVPDVNGIRYVWGQTDSWIVIVIDSCEYLLSAEPTRGDYEIGPRALTHKGNCKYCMERQRKLGFKNWGAAPPMVLAPDGDSAIYISLDTNYRSKK